MLMKLEAIIPAINPDQCRLTFCLHSPYRLTIQLGFQFESVFNLEFQPKYGIQLGIPISKFVRWE